MSETVNSFAWVLPALLPVMVVAIRLAAECVAQKKDKERTGSAGDWA